MHIRIVISAAMHGIRGWCIAASLSALAFGVAAQETALKMASGSTASSPEYRPGFIHSIESANAALAEAAAERGRIEARYGAEERACHSHFFATRCIDEAKERRRSALSQMRPIEIEANTFKRQARVAERERALKSKQETADDRYSRSITPGEEIDPGTASSSGGLDEAKVPRIGLDPQNAMHWDQNPPSESELKKVEPKEDAKVRKKRAENVAAYQRKVLAVEARQRKILARKAERERKRLAKESPQLGLR